MPYTATLCRRCPILPRIHPSGRRPRPLNSKPDRPELRMETSPQTPKRSTLTLRDLWCCQLYLFAHFFRLSPSLKTSQIMICLPPIICLGQAVYLLCHQWITSKATLAFFIAASLGCTFDFVVISVLCCGLIWFFGTVLACQGIPTELEMVTCCQGNRRLVLHRNDVYSLANEINYIYIVAKSKYVIIPKPAFATVLDAQAYYEQISDWWRGETLYQEGVWPPRPQR
jgi:hypothetical protein